MPSEKGNPQTCYSGAVCEILIKSVYLRYLASPCSRSILPMIREMKNAAQQHTIHQMPVRQCRWYGVVLYR